MFLPEVALYTHGRKDAVIFKAQELILLRNRSHRDEASMAGYRILHLIILCLGSVPDSLPSALARGVLQLSTNNQSYSRQNATGYEPDILQITTSEFELFPLRCNRTTKFSLYNISWWAGQVIRTLVGVQQDPMTISKTWHSVLLLIFSPFVSFLPFPSHILSWFISFFSFFRLYFLFFFFFKLN